MKPFQTITSLRSASVMVAAHWHTYQVLTKRSDRMREMLTTRLLFAARQTHVWWGVSVENKRHGVPRIADLKAAPAAVRFLSIEPLLEDLGALDLSGIDWVIVGGESGFGARPMKREWVISIRKQCRKYGIPFFFKQWGGVHKAVAGRKLDGRTYDEMPSPVAAGTACFKGTKLGAFACRLTTSKPGKECRHTNSPRLRWDAHKH